jgi:hypothetical protein
MRSRTPAFDKLGDLRYQVLGHVFSLVLVHTMTIDVGFPRDRVEVKSDPHLD